MISTWDDFFNMVQLTEMRIDREYSAALRSKDDAGMTAALRKYGRLNELLDDMLGSIRQSEGAVL
jgi:hypothetical protein